MNRERGEATRDVVLAIRRRFGRRELVRDADTAAQFRENVRALIVGPGLSAAAFDQADWEAVYDHFFPRDDGLKVWGGLYGAGAGAEDC